MKSHLDDEQLAPEAKRSRAWTPFWDIKGEDDLNRLLEQCETIRKGHGGVLRSKGWPKEREKKRDRESIAGGKKHGEDLGPAPEWDQIGSRGQTAKLLHEAGLESKAYRYGRCLRYAIPLQGHVESCDLKGKSFVRYHCGLRFCAQCSPSNYSRLFKRSAPAVATIVERHANCKDYTLARVSFTIRSTGEVPTSAEIRTFNQAIRKLFKRAIPEGAPFGLVWSDEFGSETYGHIDDGSPGGLNLHAHGVYFGPYLSWYKVRDVWIELTGSRGLTSRKSRVGKCEQDRRLIVRWLICSSTSRKFPLSTLTA